MHARIIVQEVRDAGQRVLDLVIGRTGGDNRNQADHRCEFVVDPVCQLSDQEMFVRDEGAVAADVFDDIRLHFRMTRAAWYPGHLGCADMAFAVVSLIPFPCSAAL
jgi:hypothetical protein